MLGKIVLFVDVDDVVVDVLLYIDNLCKIVGVVAVVVVYLHVGQGCCCCSCCGISKCLNEEFVIFFRCLRGRVQFLRG